MVLSAEGQANIGVFNASHSFVVKHAEKIQHQALVGIEVATGYCVNYLPNKGIRFIGVVAGPSGAGEASLTDKSITGDTTATPKVSISVSITKAIHLDAAVVGATTAAIAMVGRPVYITDNDSYTITRQGADDRPRGEVIRWISSAVCDVIIYPEWPALGAVVDYDYMLDVLNRGRQAWNTDLNRMPSTGLGEGGLVEVSHVVGLHTADIRRIYTARRRTRVVSMDMAVDIVATVADTLDLGKMAATATTASTLITAAVDLNAAASLASTAGVINLGPAATLLTLMTLTPGAALAVTHSAASVDTAQQCSAVVTVGMISQGNEHYQLQGTDAVDTDLSWATGGGITMAPGEDDENILWPHLHSDAATELYGISAGVGTARQPAFLAEFQFSAVTSAEAMHFCAGLKLTSTRVTATDADQLLWKFLEGTDTFFESVYSIAGVDVETASAITPAATTHYSVAIVVDVDRIPSFYISSGQGSPFVLVKTGTALTSTTLFPRIGQFQDGATANNLTIRRVHCSQAFA